MKKRSRSLIGRRKLQCILVYGCNRGRVDKCDAIVLACNWLRLATRITYTAGIFHTFYVARDTYSVDELNFVSLSNNIIVLDCNPSYKWYLSIERLRQL